ncbi:hypothetical protein CMI37_37740 [Candidatus Pacearchaeota archaeon]|nr:hypothetical protein [Candidatus Pacearchaeota archaeon]
MARTRTLQQLRDEIRNRADVTANDIPDAELDALINGQLARLYRLLTKVNQDYFLSDDTVTVVSGTDEYALPSDFWQVLGVDYQAGNYWYAMPRFTFSERNKYQRSSVKEGTAYRVMGANIRFAPVPTWGGTVRLYYIPASPLLVNAGDTVDGFCGFEDYAVVCAVIAIKSKNEEDISAEALEQKALYADIHASAAERDPGEPDRVRDVNEDAMQDLYPTG